MSILTPQPYIVGTRGGWSIPVSFTDALDNPVDLTKAGLTPCVDFYQGNLRRTTPLEVDLVNGVAGSVVAIVPQDVVQSTLFASQAGLIVGAAPVPTSTVSFHAYVVDSRGVASAHQFGLIQPIDPRTADLSSIPAPQPIVGVVGPAGAPGSPGSPGSAGADGSSAPQSATAAGPIARLQVIYADPTGALPASSDQPGEAGLVLGIALAAAATGQAVSYTTGGSLSDPSFNWRPGPVYLGLGGALTQAVPTSGMVQAVGTATAPGTILVRVERPIVLALPAGAAPTVTYRDAAAGEELVRPAAVEGPAKSQVVATGPDGYLHGTLFGPQTFTTSRLVGGPQLASLPNGTFEDGVAGVQLATTGTGDAAVDGTTSAAGVFSIYLHCAAAGDTAGAASSLVPAAEGVALYVGTRARLRGGSPNCALSALFYDGNRNLLATTPVVPALALLPAYAEFGAYVVPPAGTRYAAASIVNTGALGAVGAANVDEMMLHHSRGGPRTAQVTRAARPALIAAGGTFSAFLQFCGGPDASDGTWEAIYVSSDAPFGGLLYGALSSYLLASTAGGTAAAPAPAGLGLGAAQAAPILSSIWAAAAAVTP